jgi:ribosomal protein S18 acetylase RimI-like enzyme
MKLSNIEYKLLPNTFKAETLINFLFTHGQTEYNWCPEQPVRDHFAKLNNGKIFAWGAFLDEMLVGLITAKLGGQFCHHYGEKTSAEIIEFVVHPKHRNIGIGTALVNCAKNYLFEQHQKVKEVYVMVHASNVVSSRAFIKEGFVVVITFDDPFRNRNTTVLKVTKPSTTRVLGIQSGNAVDGIDIVVVDFEEPLLSAARTVSQLGYHVVAFETFPWSPEKQSLGTRKKQAFPTEFGNEERGMQSIEAGIPKQSLGTRKPRRG